MLPPSAYLDARRNAQSHVQVEIIDLIENPARNACHLRTRIHYAWKGQGHAGEIFDFTVPCLFEGDNMPCGGTLWYRQGELRIGGWLEGFFDGGRAARDQVFRIEALRKTPWFNTKEY